MAIMKTIAGFFSARSNDDPIKKYSSLHVRTNSLITLDVTPFLIHDEYLVMENPGSGHQVTHIGEHVLHGMNVFKFYIKSDIGNDNSCIQVTECDGEADAILFRQIDEIYPQSISDWNDWTGTDQVDGLLQWEVFTLKNDNDEVVYSRAWESDLVNCVEKIVPDDATESPYSFASKMMLYQRDISEKGSEPFTEYLMVSIEEEERVCIYVGIDLPMSGLIIS